MRNGKPPYIGVTGVTHPDQIGAILQSLPHRDIVIRIMAGVLLSNSRISGAEPSQPNRYPPTESIPDIFFDHPQLLNLIHYRPQPHLPIAEQLDQAYRIAGPHCHGIQINPHPDRNWIAPGQLAHFKRQHPQAHLVYQISPAIIAQSQDNPEQIARTCREYAESCHHFIIDPSGGNRIQMDVRASAAVAQAIINLNPQAEITFAGGLGPLTVAPIVAAIRKAYPHTFSIDAEGSLRDHHDRLSIKTATQYVRAALEAFS